MYLCALSVSTILLLDFSPISSKNYTLLFKFDNTDKKTYLVSLVDWLIDWLMLNANQP